MRFRRRGKRAKDEQEPHRPEDGDEFSSHRSRLTRKWLDIGRCLKIWISRREETSKIAKKESCARPASPVVLERRAKGFKEKKRNALNQRGIARIIPLREKSRTREGGNRSRPYSRGGGLSGGGRKIGVKQRRALQNSLLGGEIDERIEGEEDNPIPATGGVERLK